VAFNRVNSLCGPRKPAGRHITVLATQPRQIGESGLRAEVDGTCDSNPTLYRYRFCLLPSPQRGILTGAVLD
jgi:hypothetical protein